MTKITFIEADGTRTEAIADPGQTVMQLAVDNGVAGVAAECGGACACGTCHCYIEADTFEALGPAAPNEVDMLEFVIDPKPNSRLTCQIVITPEMDGLVVSVPRSQT